MKAQTKLILDYMERNGSITALQAVQDLGVTRLSARIWDLRNDGYEISREMQTSLNRYGDKVTFGVYRIDRRQDDQRQLCIL